jgi:threonine dehydratase
MVVHDLSLLPGFEAVHRYPYSAAVFESGLERVTIVLANRTALQRLGLPPQEVIGLHFSRFVSLEMAVARAARLLGIHAVIVMPEDAPSLKVDRVRADGAELMLAAPGNDARRALAEQMATERQLTLVPPYDDPEIIAGQGTCGLEIVEDLPDVGEVLVPVSGGGLISGVAAAVKALVPTARIVGVEPDDAADARESMQAGEIRTWPTERTHQTIADGLRVNRVGDLPWVHIKQLVDEIVTVSDEAMRSAIRELALRSRLVIEPSGAAGMAAHLTGAAGPVRGSRVIVLSGGNIDPEMYRSILAEGSGA